MNEHPGHIRSLDGVRAVAVLVVFVGHGATGVGTPWPGHVGVTIFFFLSGFLIVTLLRREHERTHTVSIRKFYLRRLLRILPPAYVAIAAASVVGAFGWLDANTDGWGVLSEALNYTNYFIVIHGRDGLPPETSQFWSLGVEEHYYLVIPALLLVLLARWDRRRVGWSLIALAALVVLWRVVLGVNGASFDRLYISSDTRIDSLLAGSAMALLANPALGDALPGGDIAARSMRWVPGVAALVFVASAFVPVQAFRLSIADCVQYVCLAPIFWHVITRADSLTARLLNHPVVAWIGVLSYSIYLFHRIVLGLVGNLGLPAVPNDLASFVISIGVAYVVHVLVERPCAGWRRRLESGQPVGRATAG